MHSWARQPRLPLRGPSATTPAPHWRARDLLLLCVGALVVFSLAWSSVSHAPSVEGQRAVSEHAKLSLVVEAGDAADEVVVSIGSGGARTRLRVSELLQLITDAAGGGGAGAVPEASTPTRSDDGADADVVKPVVPLEPVEQTQGHADPSESSTGEAAAATASSTVAPSPSPAATSAATPTLSPAATSAAIGIAASPDDIASLIERHGLFSPSPRRWMVTAASGFFGGAHPWSRGSLDCPGGCQVSWRTESEGGDGGRSDIR